MIMHNDYSFVYRIMMSWSNELLFVLSGYVLRFQYPNFTQWLSSYISPPAQENDTVLILIHGVRGSAHDFIPFLTKLKNEKYTQGTTPIPLDFDCRTYNYSHYVDNTEDLKKAIQDASGIYKNIILIGHSHGGRLLHETMQKISDDPIYSKIKGCIAIASPITDTVIVNFVEKLRGIHAWVKSMVDYLIEFVYRLKTAYHQYSANDALPHNEKFTYFVSSNDFIVGRASNQHPQADAAKAQSEVLYSQLGHMSILADNKLPDLFMRIRTNCK